jgi:transcriptional regulator with XRE-family HTH domain
MTNVAFVQLMRSRMEQYYIADIDLARALGVAPSLVRRWTRGEAAPAREDLLQLGATLGLSSQELQTLLSDVPAIDSAPRPPVEVIEQFARENWGELRLLPPAFREAVLVAQLRAVTT